MRFSAASRSIPLRMPKWRKSFGARLCRRFPYAVYFTLRGADIIILAVLHQRRDQQIAERRQGRR